MKRITISVILIISLLGLAACSSGGSEVVVKTKAGDITKDEFYEELKDIAGEQILQELIVIKVLEDKFDVDSKAIDEEVDKIKEQLGESFEFALMQQGIADEEGLKTVLHRDLLYQEAIYGNVDISEEEAKEFYERQKTEIEAQHILVTDEDEAKDIKKKLDDGEKFEDLAKEFSIDGSAETGGDLGYFSAGNMVKEFEDAAYDMEVDTISDIVKTQNGFHIIKVNDKRDVEGDMPPFEEIEEEIMEQLKMTKVSQDEGVEKINKLIEDAKVDIKIKELEDIFDDAPEDILG